MNEELMEKINSKVENSWNQGIFKEPYGIPDDIKEYVVYTRIETGGVEGGSCWDNSNPCGYTAEPPENEWEVLDILLEELKPDITLLQYRKLLKLVKSNTETDWEYYGNCTNYIIKFIILKELEEYLEKL